MGLIAEVQILLFLYSFYIILDCTGVMNMTVMTHFMQHILTVFMYVELHRYKLDTVRTRGQEAYT